LGLRRRVNPHGKSLRQFDFDFIEIIPRFDLGRNILPVKYLIEGHNNEGFLAFLFARQF
jgi:hypothetical protein